MTATTVSKVRVNGAELHHEVRGDGPAILMIAGATGDAGYLAPLADHLADEFTVVTYDRRGNSRSPRPAGWTKTSTEEQADDGAGLIEALGLAPTVLYGTSGGAIIALDMLLRHSRLVDRAVLHEPPLISVLERPEETGSTLKALIEGGMSRGGPPAAAEDFLTYVSGGALDSVDRVVRERMLGNAETLFSIEFGVFESYRPDAATLASGKVPVTVTTGRETLPLFRETAAWLATGLGTPLEEVPGGHAAHFDRPRELADALRQFLRHVRTSGGGNR